jgi:hypothetical protein
MPEKKRDKQGWLLAFRFPNMETAGKAYQRARNVVFGRDIDTTVYRVQLEGIAHVVVLGDGPLTIWSTETFTKACAGGEATSIPEDVKRLLEKRRQAGKVPGAFWEANHRPGIGVPRRPLDSS